MRALKINIPDGFKIKSFDEKTGDVHFEPVSKDIKERIKTFEDVLLENNINQAHFDDECEGLEPDEVAYKKIKLIAKALNEGWTPDWTNDGGNKYYPWFIMGSPSGSGFAVDDCAAWITISGVGSRLCFKSGEMAKYAGTQFEDIYKDFLT